MRFEDIYSNVPAPHIPEKLPVELGKALFNKDIIRLISKANNALGAYKGFLVNTSKARAMLDRYNEYKEICISKMSSKYAIMLLDEIFKRPAFKARQIQDIIPGSKGTLYNMLDEFVEKGILKKDDKARNTTYFCPAILRLL